MSALQLSAVNDTVVIAPPEPRTLTLAPPSTDVVTAEIPVHLTVVDPPRLVEVLEPPPTPPLGIFVPVIGPAGPATEGPQGPKGDPGAADVPDLPDLTTIFENGLI